jgi:exosortase/archaeosortase family protein
MARPARMTEAGRARLRFALIFASVAGVSLGLYAFPYAAHGARETLFAGYLAAYARAAGALVHLTDPAARVTGAEIAGRTSLVVAKNCDAMDVSLLLVSAIVAFPARWTRRLAGIAGGLALLTAVNLLRIVCLYQINLRAPDAFEFVHAELFPFVMVAVAVAAFAFWSRWSRAVDGPK